MGAQEAGDEVALGLEKANDLRADSRAGSGERRFVLVLPVDPEQLRVLAADAQDEALPVQRTLKLWLVIPPPSGSKMASPPGHSRSITAPGSTRSILNSCAMASRAVLFDFNGTLSDDERIMCEIFQLLFAEKGKPMSEQDYFGELVGLSDVEVAAPGSARTTPGSWARRSRATGSA